MYKGLRNPWRLQLKHLWQLNPNRYWVFWGRQLTATMLGMAACADGGIVITEPPCEQHMGMAANWLQQAYGLRRHWTLVLEEAILCRPAEELLPFLDEAGIGGLRLEEFERNCTRVARKRLQEGRQAQGRLKVIEIRGRIVQEEAGGWSCLTPYHRICDARLLVDEICTDPEQETTFKGVIQFQGHTLKIEANYQEVQTNTFAWMQQSLQQAGYGTMHFDPFWSRYALEIAVRLHPPAEVHAGESAQSPLTS